MRGGVGEAKTCGNYAASLLAGERAHEHGFTQVLWLDGVERKYVEEVGSMNIFFVIDDAIVTPALSGSILPGITRDSVIRIAAEMGITVEERALPREMLYAADELFFTGTAAEITPIRSVDRIVVGAGRRGPVTSKIQEAFFEIVEGKVEDRFGWLSPVGTAIPA